MYIYIYTCVRVGLTRCLTDRARDQNLLPRVRALYAVQCSDVFAQEYIHVTMFRQLRASFVSAEEREERLERCRTVERQRAKERRAKRQC